MLIDKKWTPALKNKAVIYEKNTTGSGLIVGQTYYLYGSAGTNPFKVYVSTAPDGPAIGGWAYATDFRDAIHTTETLTEDIEQLRKEIKGLQTNLRSKESVLKFLKEHKIKEITPELLKTYQIMDKLKLGSLEDAREIVAILNS